jgi:hypothetical protein
MTMRSVRSRVRPAPQEAVSYRKHGSGKTGISPGSHLDLILSGWMMRRPR